MIRRTLEKALKKAASEFPIVSITGPRQSGKTTLSKAVFKDYDYVSLELPDEREFALNDPRGFLARFKAPVIFDEVQRTPDLFSYLQVMVDKEPGAAGRFVLIGSHNFLLMQNVSQSLAGRCAVLNLLPFSLAELMGREPTALDKLGKSVARKVKFPKKSLMDVMFTGFYPRIHDRNLSPRDWLANYYLTYVERDVRNVLQVGDIETFGRFVRLCAGRNGQLLNLSGLASDCGISPPTAKRWLSVLEAGFIVTLLRPHRKNFGKRMIKSPKLHFIDTGLLCYLLQVRSPDELFQRAERSAVFESLVISELYKNFIHRGEQPSLYFWRDSTGHEIDAIIDMPGSLLPIEIKSAQTVAADFFDPLTFWEGLSGGADEPAALVYGGDRSFRREGVVIYPWFVL